MKPSDMLLVHREQRTHLLSPRSGEGFQRIPGSRTQREIYIYVYLEPFRPEIWQKGKWLVLYDRDKNGDGEDLEVD